MDLYIVPDAHIPFDLILGRNFMNLFCISLCMRELESRTSQQGVELNYNLNLEMNEKERDEFYFENEDLVKNMGDVWGDVLSEEFSRLCNIEIGR